jgi:tetratricopeptide (TPR) repeat protein
MAATRGLRPASKRRRVRLWLAALAVGIGGLWWGWLNMTPKEISLGVAAYNRGNWSEAEKLALERLRIAKDDPEGLRLLARASARLGRHPTAQALYAGLAPKLARAEDYYLLGLGKSTSGEAVAAQSFLSLAVAADPRHVEALNLLAMVSLQTARVSEATQAAERLARQPGSEARGDLLLGVICATDQAPSGAVEALRRAIKRDPTIRILPSDQFGTLRLLARCLLRIGQPAGARETLRTVLDVGPDREASWLLSRAYLQDGNGAEAAAALAQSGTYRAEHPLEPEPSPYVGEARCAGCHADVRKLVLASRHASTLRRGSELADLPLPEHPLTDPGDSNVSHTLKQVDGQVRVETRVQDKVLRAVVDYALGSVDRYTTLVGRDDQGRARTLRLSYHRGGGGSGWDLSKAQAAHPECAEDFLGEPFGSIAAAQVCLVCHSTNARAVRDQTGPESNDRAIGCERCHGPGGLHLAAVTAKFSQSAIASSSLASSAEINQMCGECHSQHFLAMPAARTAPDWTRFPGSTLPWSRCYTESGGALSCVTCHDPHKNAETVPAFYEAKCLSCHVTSRANNDTGAATAALENAGTAFQSPCPVNPKRDCVRCHMPKVPYDWLHGGFTDHYIRVQRSADSASQAGGGSSAPLQSLP